MKIVIDIDEQIITDLRNGYARLSEIADVVKNGAVLPKGHGDLIDKSKIYKAIPAEEDNCTGMGMSRDEMETYNEGIDVMYSLVQGAPTIIKADKEAEND